MKEKDWLLDFERNPNKELENVMRRNISVGAISRLSTSEILSYTFKDANDKLLSLLDNSFEEFFKKVLNGYIAADLSNLRWAEALSEFFVAIDSLKLSKSLSLLISNYQNFRVVLRKFYHSPVLDPEYSFLRTLALNQNDDSLFSTWFALCGMQELLPAHYAPLGFLGLRKLHSSDSSEPPKSIYSALILYAEAIQKLSGISDRAKEEMFLSEFRFIKSLYPKFPKPHWVSNFLLHDVQSFSIACTWIEKDLGKIADNAQSYLNTVRSKVTVLRSPMPQKTDDVIESLDNLTNQSCKSIVSFFNDHKQYYLTTGESKFLSKAYTNIAVKSKYPQLTEALLTDAFNLTYLTDPYVWTNLAIHKSKMGEIADAIGLLFLAKKKFPYNEWVRNILGILLLKNRKFEQAEFVFRQAIIQVKKSEYAYMQLLKMLLHRKKTTEAEDVVAQAVNDFPDSKNFKEILGSILMQQSTTEKLDRAKKIFKKKLQGKSMSNSNSLGSLILEIKDNKGHVSEDLERKAKIVAAQLNDTNVSKAIKSFVNKEVNIAVVEKAFTDNLISNALKETNSDKIFGGLEDISEADILTGSTMLDNIDIKAIVDSIISDAQLGSSSNVLSKSTLNFYAESGDVELYSYAAKNLDEKYRRNALTLADSLCKKHPSNPAALLQKGWVLLNLKENSTTEFFEKQVKLYNNSPGFHVGLLRSKGRLDQTEWNTLLRRFPAYETAIRLSHTLKDFDDNGNWNNELIKKLGNRIKSCQDKSGPSENMNNYENWVYDMIEKNLPVTTQPTGEAREDVAPPGSSNLYYNNTQILWSVTQEFLEIGMN